jgi:hypothetical protein
MDVPVRWACLSFFSSAYSREMKVHVFLFCRDPPGPCHLGGLSLSEIGLYPRVACERVGVLALALGITFDLGPHAPYHKVTLNSESQGWIRCCLGLGQKFSRERFISVESMCRSQGTRTSNV